MADAFAELRSMILLELCCPPLPVMATRQETGQETITNTHDMMSVFMVTAFRRQDEEDNARRRKQQFEIERIYQEGLEQCTNFHQAYAHMTQFSTDYLASYLLPGAGFTKHDIHVLPPEHISPVLTEEIRSYSRALQTITGEEERDLSDCRVQSLFMSCIRSAIHKKQQSVVGVPVLVGVGDDIDEEGHNPKALEPCIEVL
jgi:hypothetical protein